MFLNILSNIDPIALQGFIVLTISVNWINETKDRKTRTEKDVCNDIQSWYTVMEKKTTLFYVKIKTVEIDQNE